MADDTTDPLTEGELAAAIQQAEWFAVRLRGLFALAKKSRQLLGLLGAEREKRQILADLDQRAAALREVVATADAAQARLDGISAELERHRATAEAEAKRITDAAHAAAHDIVENAQTQAAKTIAEGCSTAAAEAERQAGEARERQQDIERLDVEIAARRTERDGINRAITELRASIGA
jgi:cell division septum initiation protein DivIVA